MRKVYDVVIQRTVRQTLTVTRSGYDPEEVIESAMDEAGDNPVWLGWEDKEVLDLELLDLKAAWQEADE